LDIRGIECGESADWIHLAQDMGLHERCDKPSGSIKGREFLR